MINLNLQNMKTTITKKLLGLALSVFSIAAIAQCPTSVSVNVVSNLANGNLTVSQTYNVPTNTTSVTYNHYTLYGATNYYALGYGMNSTGNFSNVVSGTYTLCLSDSVSCGGFFNALNSCMLVTITNTNSAACNAAFTLYTDSNCVTHFTNTSTGTNLTYQWYDMSTGFSLFSTSANPSTTFSNGTHTIGLYTYSGGAFCDSLTQVVTISCNPTGTTSCNAAFSYYTDTTCTTHFYGSPANAGYSMWYIDGITYSYTPSVSLANGNHNVTQIMYDQNGLICDSSYQYISVYCPSSSTVTPNCNAGFVYYTDSACVTYFYNTSVTNNGYVIWNVDGTTYSVTPTVNLANGYHNVYQTVYDQNGFICDTAYQSIYVSCQNSGTTTPTGCQVNSQFYVFADSLNAGNYFAYNFSSGTGNLSYLWNFGDGTSSTQQYPFHQYSVPGQYVICLTVTATYSTALGGLTTCSDTYCDSSSVQRMAAGFQMSQVNVIPFSVTGIKQTEKEIGLKAFPNPIADELTIEAITTNDNQLTFVLVDALGRTISTGNINNSKAIINTSNLEKGFYSLSITNEKGNSLKTVKLVK